MENASKALLMAGSLLLSLIIIGALVFMFRSITGYQGTNYSTTEEQQITEFNKSYASFEKNLYGTELLSLINKAIDYNAQYEADGYKPMAIVFAVKNGNTLVPTNVSGYNTTEIDTNNTLRNLINGIPNIEKKYKGSKYLTSLITLYDKYTGTERENEIKNFMEKNGLTYDNKTIDDIKKYSEYIEFKRKKFKYVNTVYDGEESGSKNSNGRIVKMTYEEII